MNRQVSQYPAEALRQSLEENNEPLAEEDLDRLCELLEFVFFASLQHEEGAATPLAVLVEAETKLERIQADSFGSPAWLVQRVRPVTVTPEALKKLARGVKYGRDALIASWTEQGWMLTGTARRASGAPFEVGISICAPRPGVLSIEGTSRQSFRYEAGQLLESELSVTDAWGSAGLLAEALNALGVPSSSRWELTALLREARHTECGAMFVFETGTPRGTGEPKVVFANRGRLPELLKKREAAWPLLIAGTPETQASARDELRDIDEERTSIVETVGRFAAIDGAVIVKPGFEIYGAGAIVKGDFTGGAAMPVPLRCRGAFANGAIPEPLTGGARHRSAADYTWANEGSVVFCISADGPVTAFLRRGEALLKWHLWLREF